MKDAVRVHLPSCPFAPVADGPSSSGPGDGSATTLDGHAGPAVAVVTRPGTRVIA
ncbi:hypothetical protein [Streptosporangium carneum]|uniref:Uncharacterized protein n=1 Tax=Streptosporangium carneum TaxID=47481 RepID=A0A9W6HYD3_9ACTN|nr:hypothetical protein [Streptosporangium carneum]GLK07868.1 hypothetical protein GCM10017600_12730 [Streptosporangium carneum]